MQGFVHSAPVPQIYKAAATIAELVQERGQSIKELVFSKKYSRINTKGLYALIVETLQHESILCDIIRESKILADGRMKPWLARVLITELLWGKKKLPPNDCKPIQAVLDLHPAFLAFLKKAVLDGTHENEPRANKALAKPRYVRVNTLKISVEDAMDAFLANGWYRGYPELDNDYSSYLAKVANIDEMEFIQDFHVKEVFAFPPRTEFYGHELYKTGMLVLQDKATCLAPFLLCPPAGSVVLDMCAAPGLKTTQLAAMMQNTGTIFAAEKSQPRYRTLVEFAANHGATITPIHSDASTLTPVTCADVEYILIDPSCSGSGMARHTSHDFEPGRVEKLAGFQAILLERALMNFPTVKKVVYSTCSNYVEENEQVVEKVLKTVNPDPENPNFKLADVLVDSWVSRGSDEYECGPKCIYAREDVDLTTGFFMAVFERIGNGTFEIKFKRKRIRGKKMREKVHNEGNDDLIGKGEPKEEGTEQLNKTVSEDFAEDRMDNGEVRKTKKKRKRKEETEAIGEEAFENTSTLVEDEEVAKKKKKKHKRKKETEAIGEEEFENTSMLVEGEEIAKKKKKKKHKRKDEAEAISNQKFENTSTLVEGEEVVKKKKEKRKRDKEMSNEGESIEEDDKGARKKERKRRKREKLEQNGENEELEANACVVKRKKHKKNKNVEEQER